jgi:GntR family histidine utilization transcriptional repressor
VDVATHLPRYIEIRRALTARIMSGDWRPGHRVPSEHELMEQFGCSRMTVNEALSALAAAGLIVRKGRSGATVASPRSHETTLQIHDIRAEVLASGRSYKYEILRRRMRKATRHDIGQLNLNSAARVVELSVLHFTSNIPFVLEDRIISLDAVPDAEAEDFATTPPNTWLLAHIPWTQAEQAIRAVPADARSSSALQVNQGTACLIIERRTWQAGLGITWVRLCYPGDRHTLVARFAPGGHIKGGQEVL